MTELPKGWSPTKVKELAGSSGIFVDGDWIESKDQDPNGAIRLLQLADIGDGTFLDKSDRWINDGAFERLRCTELAAGDVLIARMPDPLGRACLMPSLEQRCVTVVDVAALRVDPQVANHRWVMHSINAPQLRAEMYVQASGTTRKRISRGNLGNLQIPLAPAAEQQRIADKLDIVLTRVSAVNTRLDQVAYLLKRFRQSVLAAATSGRLTEDWRNSAGVSSAWQTTEVQSVAQVGTGSTPLRSNPAFFSLTGTPWVTSAATSSEIVNEANEYVTPEAIAAHRLKVFPVGTLLVAMYGEGKTRGQVTQLGIPATINQACAAVVVDESKMLRDFVKLALQANYLEMRVLAEGGNQPNLNLAKVKGFPLPLPSMEEQTEIVRRVETLFAFANRIEARLQAAQTAADRLTPALLAKAFRGELVPQDPNDEPASELLKRLAEQGPTSKTTR
jgi:type I restriction enzyme S subunit